MKNINHMLGWAGAGMLILAYALVSFRAVAVEGVVYHALNLAGSAGIVVTAMAKKDYPPAWLNIVWSFIALVGLLRLAM